MSASLPGATLAENQGNPTQGTFVMFDALSGPEGSPFAGGTDNLSTGGLSTGIGFGGESVFQALKEAGFSDDYTPGVTLPDGNASSTSILVYIGGGRSTANADGDAPEDPYTANQVALCGAGNGASRDGGAGTGFRVKSVTATGTVANGAAVETGFLNRTGGSITIGQSIFGSAINANTPV